MKRIPRFPILALTALAHWPAARAQVVFSGSAYTQDFQSMTASALTPATIANTTMTEVSGLSGGGSVSGWYVYGAAGVNRWGRNAGGSATASFFGMFDSASTPNLALGSLAGSSSAGFFGVVIQNTTGSTITSFSFNYDAVIAKNPSTTVNSSTLSYLSSSDAVVTSSSTGAGTFSDSAGIWTTSTGFLSPSSGIGAPGTQAAITPHFQIGGARISVTLSALSWTNNGYLYLRWSDTDESGYDAMMGIDNFTVSAIPEPSTYATIFGAAALAGAVRYRRRQKQEPPAPPPPA